MRIINHTQNTILSERAAIADTVFSRMQGLLGRESLHAGEALVITQCNSIHMFFMRFPIDVVFIDKDDNVVGLLENIPPNTLSPVYWRANRAIELPVGTVARTKTKIRDKVCVIRPN